MATTLLRDCPDCGGTGYPFARSFPDCPALDFLGPACGRCDGAGEVPRDRCDCGAPNPIAVIDGVLCCGACLDLSGITREVA